MSTTMKLVMAGAAISAAGAVITNAQEAERIFCNVGAFTPAERAAHEAQTAKLRAAAIEMRELNEGIAVRVDSAKFSMADLGTWADAERKCCAFLSFAIRAEPHGGALWLELTGPAGTREFLREAIGR